MKLRSIELVHCVFRHGYISDVSFQSGTPCQMIVSLLSILLGYSNLIFCQLISLYSVNYTNFVFSIWQYISAYIVPLLALLAIANKTIILFYFLVQIIIMLYH